MVDLSDRFKQNPNMVSREIQGEVILVPIRNEVGDFESIYTLNETAAFAWSLVDGQRTLEEIHEQIVNEFNVEVEPAGGDLLELVEGLQEIGAVQKV